jgi:hypothetical protein
MRVDVHHTDGCGGGERPENGIRYRVIAARGNRQHAGCMHLAIKRLDLFDLLREVEAVREPHIAEVRDPAEIVGIQFEAEIERPH